MSRTVREVNPRLKREAILTAALELFSDLTYEGTPMPLVAERAGVGAGTIYRHFESKEALVNAVYRRWMEEKKRVLVDALPAAPAREQFHHWWRALWSFATENPKAIVFLETHHHAPYLDAESLAVRGEFLAGVLGVVAAGQAAGVLKQAPPAMLSALVLGSFTGLLKSARERGRTVTEETIAQAEECVWDMIKA